MFLNAIAKPIQNLYSEIPGNTHSDKAAFVCGATLFAASGYVLRERVSSISVILLMQNVPFVAAALQYKEISQFVHGYGIEPAYQNFISQASFSFGIGVMVHEALISVKAFRNRSSWTDRIMYFCLTYSAAYKAYTYFSSLFPKKEKRASTEEAFYFNLVLKCASIPIQLKYHPKETLFGLGLSALFAITGSIATPPPQASKVAKIFREFNYMALSVADQTGAIMSSFEQGKDLANLFGYGGKTPPSPRKR
jgi:hypothetical protein